MNAQVYNYNAKDEDADARVGQVLAGKWKVEHLLGVGAAGTVYAARHQNGMRVAIKVLHAELAEYSQIKERFLNEARATNRVAHRAVVGMHDEGVTDDGSVFLVMDLLEGETLETHLERHGVLSSTQALLVAHEILDALKAAHAVGVLHRDIKPANIFLNWDGRVMLLDFGVAHLSEAKLLTQTGIPIGTPSFMPPEQAAGRWQEVDARSDLWSLGATLFTLLSGQTVRQAHSLEDELRAALMDPVRSLRSACDAPQEVVNLVDESLALDRQRRFRDAASMQQRVREVMLRLDIPLSLAAQPAEIGRAFSPFRPATPDADERPSSVRLKSLPELDSQRWALRIRGRSRLLRVLLPAVAVVVPFAAWGLVTSEPAVNVSRHDATPRIAMTLAKHFSEAGSLSSSLLSKTLSDKRPMAASALGHWLTQLDPQDESRSAAHRSRDRAQQRQRLEREPGQRANGTSDEPPPFDPLAARE